MKSPKMNGTWWLRSVSRRRSNGEEAKLRVWYSRAEPLGKYALTTATEPKCASRRPSSPNSGRRCANDLGRLVPSRSLRRRSPAVARAPRGETRALHGGDVELGLLDSDLLHETPCARLHEAFQVLREAWVCTGEADDAQEKIRPARIQRSGV